MKKNQSEKIHIISGINIILLIILIICGSIYFQGNKVQGQ